ncbi:uncharacterized protein [Cicer arietinum]|uniref:Uncharacterized protein LOC101493000 n=1 Tax=Cicer arietinum TaxID=3827 RepID=A0A1S2YD58_CICAR|nr:uncharacterized protein LOC101493000 [Cicer arietinum]
MELDIGFTHSDFTHAESWFSFDTSSGYLEDAITGWDIWCKQHNLPSYPQDQKKNQCMIDHEDLFPTVSSATSQMLQENKKISNRNLSSLQNHPHAAGVKHDSPQRSCASTESHENDASILRAQWKKIAYPFELVKPGGIEGETTLKDINEQMMMNPSKPIPHPVGNSMTNSCISNSGYGISGKQVAALTRIHTRGRGSITIIRTKG